MVGHPVPRLRLLEGAQPDLHESATRKGHDYGTIKFVSKADRGVDTKFEVEAEVEDEEEGVELSQDPVGSR